MSHRSPIDCLLTSTAWASSPLFLPSDRATERQSNRKIPFLLTKSALIAFTVMHAYVLLSVEQSHFSLVLEAHSTSHSSIHPRCLPCCCLYLQCSYFLSRSVTRPHLILIGVKLAVRMSTFWDVTASQMMFIHLNCDPCWSEDIRLRTTNIDLNKSRTSLQCLIMECRQMAWWWRTGKAESLYH